MTSSLPAERDLQLSSLAKDHFDSQRFAECLEVINELHALRRNDIKIQHNTIVARFASSGASDRSALLAEFVALQRTHDHKLKKQNASEQHDDRSTIIYNEAVVRHATGELHAAAALLQPLFERASTIAELLARKVCFLLLDIYLDLCRADVAAKVVEFLERSLDVPNAPSTPGAAAAATAAAATAAAAAAAAASLSSTASSSVSTSNNVTSSASSLVDLTSEVGHARFVLSLYKARLYLLTHSVKQCKREIKLALHADSQHVAALSLKGHFEYQRENYTKCLRFLNSATPTSASQLMCHYHNYACVHFLLTNHAAASRYFSLALRQSQRLGPTMLAHRHFDVFYSHGVQLIHQGNHTLAHRFLRIASERFFHYPRVWLRLAECCIHHHVAKDRHRLTQCSSGPLITLARCHNSTKLVIDRGPKDGTDPDTASSSPSPFSFSSQSSSSASNSASSSASASSDPTSQLSLEAAIVYLRNALAVLAHHPHQDRIDTLEAHILMAMAYAQLSLGDYASALRSAQSLLNDDDPSVAPTTKTYPPALRLDALFYASESLVAMGCSAQACAMLAPDRVANLLTAVERDTVALSERARRTAPTDTTSTSTPSTSTTTATPAPPSEVTANSQDSATALLRRADLLALRSATQQTPPSRLMHTYPLTPPVSPLQLRSSLLVNTASAFASAGELPRAKSLLGAAIAHWADIARDPTAVLLSAHIDLRQGNTESAVRTLQQHSCKFEGK